MPKRNFKKECQNQRWSTRKRRQTQTYTPPGRDVPQLASNRACYSEPNVPSHEEVFNRPETTICTRADFVPSPIIIGVVSKPKKRTPDEERKEKHDVSRFLYRSFGHGFQNERKHSSNPFYRYWNRYGRSDVEACQTFETHCFLCHGSIRDRGYEDAVENGRYGNLKFAICGVPCCPKVYHTSCLDTYYPEGDSNAESWICPRHTCNVCKRIDLLNNEHCPTCPISICEDCTGEGLKPRVKSTYHEPKANEHLCRNCRITARTLDAPEMLLNLRSIC